MDQDKINEAIAYHRAHESKAPRDLRRAHDLTFAREAYGEPLGPMQPRGEPTGVIIRHGVIAAEWGEPDRVDMTHSVTKSFLSTVVGVAYDHGLIRSKDDLVKSYVPGAYFAEGHNSKITWDHLLRQTSDWEGTLWTKPDWADRPPKDIPFEKYIEVQVWSDDKRDVPYTIDKQPQILASYFCTPLVKIPIKDLKPGSKVMGTTIAEMGSGKSPMSLASAWVLFANDPAFKALVLCPGHLVRMVL